MKLAPIMDWLQAGDLGFKSIDGVESLADIDSFPASALPALFVVQADEAMRTEQDGAGLLVVAIESSFDVVIVVGAAALRGKTRDELSDLADAVKLQLLGWTPDADIYRPFVPIAGRLLGVGGGRASWLVRFRTTYRLRKQG